MADTYARTGKIVKPRPQPPALPLFDGGARA